MIRYFHGLYFKFGYQLVTNRGHSKHSFGTVLGAEDVPLSHSNKSLTKQHLCSRTLRSTLFFNSIVGMAGDHHG